MGPSLGPHLFLTSILSPPGAEAPQAPEVRRWEDVTSPRAVRVNTLKKQLTMEVKVKQGAENFIQTYTSTSVKVGLSPNTSFLFIYIFPLMQS